MSKYKVGDRVRIVSERIDWMVSEMYKYLWTIMTIASDDWDAHWQYKMEENNRNWFWCDDAIVWLADEFTRGEKVLVWDKDGEEKEERIYLATIEWAIYPHIVVDDCYEEAFEKWKSFYTEKFGFISKLQEEEEEELTMEEVCQRLGKTIKIKK